MWRWLAFWSKPDEYFRHLHFDGLMVDDRRRCSWCGFAIPSIDIHTDLRGAQRTAYRHYWACSGVPGGWQRKLTRQAKSIEKWINDWAEEQWRKHVPNEQWVVALTPAEKRQLVMESDMPALAAGFDLYRTDFGDVAIQLAKP